MLRRTFSPEGCSTGHWNESRDGEGTWRSGARVEAESGASRADWIEGPAGYPQRSVPTNRNPTRAAPMGTAVWARGRRVDVQWGWIVPGNPGDPNPAMLRGPPRIDRSSRFPSNLPFTPTRPAPIGLWHGLGPAKTQRAPLAREAGSAAPPRPDTTTPLSGAIDKRNICDNMVTTGNACNSGDDR